MITINPFANKKSYAQDFTAFTAGALGGQGGWVTCLGGFTVTADKKIQVGTNGDNCCYYNGGFGPDQRSTAIVTNVDTNDYGISVAVRCSGSGATANYYELYVDNYSTGGDGVGMYLYKTVNGVSTQLAKGTPLIAAGDSIELRVEGTTLRCYRNNNIITSMGSGINGASGSAGVYTDSSHSSGQPGISGYGITTDLYRLDNYECAEL